jgi:hypothetical protein
MECSFRLNFAYTYTQQVKDGKRNILHRQNKQLYFHYKIQFIDPRLHFGSEA